VLAAHDNAARRPIEVEVSTTSTNIAIDNRIASW